MITVVGQGVGAGPLRDVWSSGAGLSIRGVRLCEELQEHVLREPGT